MDLENVLSLAGNEQTTQNMAEFYESDEDLSMLNTELAQIRSLHGNDVKSPDDLHAQFQSNNELPCYFPIWQRYQEYFSPFPAQHVKQNVALALSDE